MAFFWVSDIKYMLPVSGETARVLDVRPISVSCLLYHKEQNRDKMNMIIEAKEPLSHKIKTLVTRREKIIY